MVYRLSGVTSIAKNILGSERRVRGFRVTDIARLRFLGSMIALTRSFSVPSTRPQDKGPGSRVEAEDARMEKAAVSLMNCARGT